jgi:hypothetical protein
VLPVPVPVPAFVVVVVPAPVVPVVPVVPVFVVVDVPVVVVVLVVVLVLAVLPVSPPPQADQKAATATMTLNPKAFFIYFSSRLHAFTKLKSEENSRRLSAILERNRRSSSSPALEQTGVEAKAYGRPN